MTQPLKPLLAAFALLALPVACGPTSDGPASPAASSVENGKMTAGKAALIAFDDAYRKAIEAEDFGKVVELSMPPLIMRELAVAGGAPTDASDKELISAVKADITAAFNQIDRFDYTMPVDNADIEISSAGREFALLPTNVDMEINGMNIRSTGDSLALVDNGKWYLLNPADIQTIDVIKRVYPDLKDLPLAPTEIEVVQ